MYQRDYILRLIEEFGNFLRHILRLRSEQNYVQAQEQLNYAGEKLLRVDLEQVASDEECLRNILKAGSLEVRQLDLLAEMLIIKGETYRESGSMFSAIRSFEHALIVFERNEELSTDYSLPRIEKMKEIRLQLTQLREVP